MNPIKTSDLLKDDGGIDAAIERLEAMQKAYIELIATIQKSAAEQATANKQAKKLTEAEKQLIKERATATDKLEKEYKKYNDALSETGKELQALKTARSEAVKLSKLEQKLATSKAGSYNALSAQYAINKTRLNQLSAAERKGTKEGKALEEQTRDIYEEMKRLQEVTGKHTLSVGDYAKANRNLLTETEELPGALGAAGQGVNDLGRKFSALAKNPIVLVIGLIIGGLTALFSAFQRSDKGARLLAKGGAVVNAVLSEAVDISVRLADTVTDAFNNPQQAVKDLGKLVLDNILNRFKSIPLVLTAIGKGFFALVNRDLKGLKQAGKDAAEALTQAVTGLDAAQQKDLINGIADLAGEVENTANKFLDLEAAQYRARKASRALTLTVEKYTTAEQVAQATADDTTKSFAAREQAAERARAALEKRAKAEIKLAQNNLSVINKELAIRRANGEQVENLLDSQLAAYREVIGAERDFTLAIRGNERERSELKQDRLERDLDILIDGFDNQKSINERLLKDENLTLQKRAQILQETEQLATTSFEKQIETVQKFTGIAINENALIGESDAVLLNEKIRGLGLSEIIEGRLLEIVRERRTVLQDLTEAQQDLNAATAATAAKARAEILSNIKAGEAAELERFEQMQALRAAEFALLKKSAAEKTEFELQAEADKLRKLLELNELYSGDLNETQKQTIKAQIEGINNAIDEAKNNVKPEDEPEDIYDLLGIEISDEKQAELNKVLNTVKQQLAEFAAERSRIAAEAVAASEREVQAAENALNRQTELQAAGLANRAETAEQDLKQAEAKRSKALKQQQKAQRRERQLQTIADGANLVSAAAKTLATFGFPTALPFIAAMFGAFAATKISAAKAARKNFAKGGMTILGGGTHASGNDTPLGFEVQGKSAYAERGEAVAVIAANKTRKYKSVLPDLIDSLNKGTFERQYSAIGEAATDIPFIMPGGSAGSDLSLSKAERALEAIQAQGENRTFINEKGQRVVKYKGTTTIYQ